MMIYGKYRGFVVDNKDPKQLRRLRVKVPALFSDVTLGWAWPCEAYGGLGEMGLIALPENGAGVWVEFEAGDPDRPIWSGCWSGAPGGNAEIPAEAKTNYPNVKALKTKAGHYVYFDDTDGKERVKLRTKSGHITLFEDKPGEEKILVRSKGQHELLIDDTSGMEKVRVKDKTGAYVLLDAVNQKIELLEGTVKIVLDKQSGNITIESQKAVNVTAPQVNLGKGTTAGVTTQAHPCLFLGTPHPGSSAVKAG